MKTFYSMSLLGRCIEFDAKEEMMPNLLILLIFLILLSLLSPLFLLVNLPKPAAMAWAFWIASFLFNTGLAYKNIIFRKIIPDRNRFYYGSVDILSTVYFAMYIITIPIGVLLFGNLMFLYYENSY